MIGWSKVKERLHDMTSNRRLLDDSVSPKKKIKAIRQTSNFRLNIICIIVRNLLLIKVLSFSSGIYLPLLWEKSFCWKSPIALAYTRGHFSSLVTMEMVKEDLIGAGANIDNNDDESVAYLPVTDYEGKLLPVPFLKQSEVRIYKFIENNKKPKKTKQIHFHSNRPHTITKINDILGKH
jgi:hypothetical protein